MRAPRRCGSETRRTLRPCRRPVSTPTRRRRPLRWNERFTLRFPSLTFARRTAERREKPIRTSADSPLTRSARPESTAIDTFGGRCRFAAAAGTASRPAAATTASIVIASLLMNPRAPARAGTVIVSAGGGAGSVRQGLQDEYLDREVGVDVVVTHEADHLATRKPFDLAAHVFLHH